MTKREKDAMKLITGRAVLILKTDPARGHANQLLTVYLQIGDSMLNVAQSEMTRHKSEIGGVHEEGIWNHFVRSRFDSDVPTRQTRLA